MRHWDEIKPSALTINHDVETGDVSIASREIVSGARWRQFRDDEHRVVESDTARLVRSCRRRRPGDNGLHRYPDRAGRSFLPTWK
jgi:hypothetical protein